MQSGALKLLDVALYKRGQSIAALARWLSVSLGLLSLALVWDDPRTAHGGALTVFGGYALFVLARDLWTRRHGGRVALKVAHDVMDALAIGLAAGFTGGMDSPIWLLLYPHVVAVAVRGGLTYAMSMGLLDAAILSALTLSTAGPPLSMLHAIAILFCAFMGGSTSSYLSAIQDRLAELNRELQAKNAQLSDAVTAHEASRREQERALKLLRDSETRQRRMEEEAKAHAERLASLLEIGRGVVERLDLSELLPLVTRSVNRVMRTRHCILLLLRGDALEMAAHEGLEPEVARAFGALRVGESLTGWVVQTGRPLALPDMLKDPRLLFVDMVRKYGYRSLLAVPLRRGAEILGTLEVVTKDVREFGPEDQALMSAFADQAAVAIENARLFEDARRHLATVVEANRQLEELDRSRRQYLRNISHEFRTPLTVIRGYAEFLLDAEPAHPEVLRNVMRIVMESCDRVIDLVDTLLDVSRIEQEGAERNLHLQFLDLKELARNAVEPLRLAAEKKDIGLRVECPSDDLTVEGDRGLLRQVVRKLVDNAVKYSPHGQPVVVRLRVDGDELALEVQDCGIGISPEEVPRIFEKFYMVDGDMSRRAGGAGVGLYLVREIVRLHNGRLAVDSQPGRGSVFSVHLPRAQADPRAAARVS